MLVREDELAGTSDRVAELQAAQGETHDRLEETLKNIERDNAEKEADLVAANLEIEKVGCAGISWDRSMSVLTRLDGPADLRPRRID